MKAAIPAHPRYLIDTDMCLRVARGESPHFRKRLAQLRPGEMGMSVMTYGEIGFAFRRSRILADDRLLERLAEAVPVVPLPGAAAVPYACLRAALARSGETLGAHRLWIFAHALLIDATLVTAVQPAPIPGFDIRCENWLAHYDASRRRRAS